MLSSEHVVVHNKFSQIAPCANASLNSISEQQSERKKLESLASTKQAKTVQRQNRLTTNITRHLVVIGSGSKPTVNPEKTIGWWLPTTRGLLRLQC
jgi:hypothetical protein